MNLKGKNVLVTGGSRGIGASVCEAMAQKGCNVAINYNTSPDKAQAVAEKVQATGGKALTIQADVSNREQVEAMVKQTTEAFGQIDIIVNNTGVTFDEGKTFVEMTDEQWDKTMAVNLTSTFYTLRAVLPQMIERKAGKVIIVGSCAGVAGQWTTVYCTSKGGQQTLTMALAREMTEHNVHVNLVAPGGAIDTDMHAGWLPEAKKKYQKDPEKGYPLESGIGLPEQISHAVVFAAENDWLHGEILKVSGGTCICP
jgi:NAD(P)-dependent dehydrogenase (short-subunit alcohol dehydrogenase family)